MRFQGLAVAAFGLVLLIAGCADDAVGPGSGAFTDATGRTEMADETAATVPPHERADATSPTTVARGEPGLSGAARRVVFQYKGTVIDGPDRGPELCGPYMLMSRPPQCWGVAVTGIDWDSVDWAETAHGTTWALLRLVGRFNGPVFEIAEASEPIPSDRPVEEEPFDTTPPCPEPDGGWRDVTPDRDDGADVVYALDQPEYAGHWTHRLPAGSATYSVSVFTFTKDIDQHETRLRELSGGALCVAEAPRSRFELELIRDDLTDWLVGAEATELGIYARNEHGLQIGAGIDTIRSQVKVTVMAAVDLTGAQRALDARYGDGAVELRSVMTRVWP